MYKYATILIVVPMLFFGIAFAEDQGSMEQQGTISSEPAMEPQQKPEEAVSEGQPPEKKEEGYENKSTEINEQPVDNEQAPSPSSPPPPGSPGY